MGHRGAMARAPENTLAGLRAAADSGLVWVEFDVMLTGDGLPVLFHDTDLKRTTGVSRPMADTPWADLRQLDAGSWFDPAFCGERVPSLAQAIEVLLDLGLRPNVEIKPADGHAEATAEAACRVLAELWPADHPPPLISSFARAALEVAQVLQPDWPRGFLSEHLEEDWQVQAAALECQTVHVHWPRIDKQRAAAVTDAGYGLAIFTVNDPAQARRLVDLGVDCIITDCPWEILEAVE